WRRGYERHWGFSRQGAAGWAGDHAKSLVVTLVLGCGAAAGAWSVIDATTWWWLWLWIAGSLLMALLVMAAPAVIAPLFNRFRELDDPDLVAATVDLGRRLGVRIRQVLVMDASRRTAKHNAYFTGLGRTKRVVVWDTLLADYERPGTLAVLAHELGHWRRHHVRWLLAITSAVLLPTLLGLHLLAGLAGTHRWFGVSSATDPAAIPLAVLVLAAAQAAWLPVAGWISRSFERQADADAVALISDPQPFLSMMRDLAVKNLSDLAPSRWAYLLASHPPAAERMALASAGRRQER
ncbi:MAG: M48 family metalloprotease, partial [Actinomycetota bacterium]